eukprot:CAMPEP_0171818470 /NCGR_PEP_ID=MMETSP0992-20121227/1671_1 /TAXON_ID=483369 /ORGANISM="non described non described, Strain CCMP2098" /LENGTH=45 /DNA_ID= /DNA_START= /DNA_END= /DNA_ORIENTATION=
MTGGENVKVTSKVLPGRTAPLFEDAEKKLPPPALGHSSSNAPPAD